MPNLPSLRSAAPTLLGLMLVWVAGCRSPGASPIVGPDGSAMAHVHCGSDQGACFRIAGQLCPTGYELTPVLRGNDGNFLLSCRGAGAALCPTPEAAPALARGVPPTPPSPSPAPPAQAAGGQAWPPAAESWPAAYPWPPPEATSDAQPGAPKPSQELDLGY